MSWTILLSVMVAGIFSSNIIATSGIGVDFATNSLNSIKNSVIYSLIIFSCAILSSLMLYLFNLLLIHFNIAKFFIVVAFLLIATIVQIAEHLIKKLLPLFYTQTKHIVPSLVCTLFIVVVAAIASTTTLLELLALIVFECIGVFLVLFIISGIRNSSLADRKPEILKGNLMNLIILLFIMMAWTAF